MKHRAMAGPTSGYLKLRGAHRDLPCDRFAQKPVRLKCLVLYTPTKTATTPCGACRQVIHEFGPEARVISICDSQNRD